MPRSDDAELPRGQSLTLILSVLACGPLHGYGIAREVERRSASLLRLGEGSLYPTLRTLENAGWVTGEWQAQEVGPARKVYALTPGGRMELERRLAAWKQYCAAVDAVLGGPSDALDPV